MDGSVLLLNFEEQELGVRASDREVQDRLSSLYGNQEAGKAAVLQDPSLLELTERLDQQSPSGNARWQSPQNGNETPHVQRSLGEQQQQKQQRQQQSSQENEMQKKQQQQEQQEKGTSKRQRATQQGQASKQQKTIAQKESRTSEGKRRITPQALATDDNAQQAQEAPVSNSDAGEDAQGHHASLPPAASQHQQQQQQQQPRTGGGASKRKGDSSRKNVLDVQMMTQSSRLSSPQVQSYLAVHSRMREYPHARLTLEVRNTVQSNSKLLCQLSLRRSDCDEALWEQRLDRAVCCASVCDTFAAVASTDGHLHLFTFGGRRMLPPLLMEDAPVFLDTKRQSSLNRTGNDVTSESMLMLLAVAANGQIYMWDLATPKCVLKENMAAVIAAATHHDTNVASVRISHTGKPLAELENHFVYLFSDDIKAWACVADSSFLHSDFSTVLAGNTNDERGELVSMQASAARSAMPSAVPSFLCGGDDLQRAETISHLETLMAASLLMGKEREHRYWLGMYARHLSRHEIAKSFRELCDTLAGQGGNVSTSLIPIASHGSGKGLELLHDVVLPQAAHGGGLQNIVREYKDIVEYYNGLNEGDNGE